MCISRFPYACCMSRRLPYFAYIHSCNIRLRVYSIQFTVYSLQYTVYSIQYTVYSIQLQYTVYSIQFTVYSLQFTVYSLQYTVYSTECNFPPLLYHCFLQSKYSPQLLFSPNVRQSKCCTNYVSHAHRTIGEPVGCLFSGKGKQRQSCSCPCREGVWKG